jgi:membrane-bound ClpP family serine protease
VSGYALWAIAGALCVLALLSLLSIGIFVLPVALVAVYVAASRAKGPGGAFGVLCGAGLVVAGIGIAHLSANDQCSEFSCHHEDFSAAPWIVVGAILIVVGVGAFMLTRRRRPPGPAG